MPLGVIAGAIAALYFATKAKAASPLPGLANLNGKVTDAKTGNPIVGATVNLNGLSVPTDIGGNYAFMDLTPGAYSGSCLASGYDTGYF